LNKRLLGPALIGLAGVLALLSYVLHWAKVTIGSASVSPVSSYVGYRNVGLFFGLILILRAVLSWRLKPQAARRWGGLAVLSGAIIGGYATYELTTEKSRSLAQLAKSVSGLLGMPLDQARAVVNAEAAKGLVKVTFTPGLWLAFAAAALAIAGGLITYRTRVEPADMPAPVRPDTPAAEPGGDLRTTGLSEVEAPGGGGPVHGAVEGSGEAESSA
jgi:hypothetical protein